MAYSRTTWKDDVRSPANTYRLVKNADETITLLPVGTVIQQGTNMSAANFNNMETGIFGAYMTANEVVRVVRELQQTARGLVGEAIDITLTNTQKFPFNNSKVSVALNLTRNITDYTIDVEVLGASGGGVGEIDVSEKLRNGFKIAFTGAAKSVRLRLLVKGGI